MIRCTRPKGHDGPHLHDPAADTGNECDEPTRPTAIAAGELRELWATLRGTLLLLASQRDELRRAVEYFDRWETIGPILDPTMYRDEGASRARLRRVMKAALTLADVAHEELTADLEALRKKSQ